MSAIAEPPVKSTKTELPAMQPLEQAFGEALKQQGGDATAPAPVPEAKKPDATPQPEAAKPAEPKPEKAPAPEPPKKKKSALDAALSDEVPPEAKPEPDEVQQLLDAPDPNWTKARETLKKQSERIKEFETKMAKANEPAPEISEKLKTYEKQLSELREREAKMKDAITALDVRYDPEFQEKYIAGRDKLISQAAAKVEAGGGDKAKFLEAMELSGARRSALLREALADVQGFERDAVGARLGQIDTLEEERDEQLKSPQKTAEEWSRKREVEAQKHEQAVEAFKQATFEKVQKQLPSISKLMRMAPADAEGAEEFNAALKADLDRAPTLLNASPEEAAMLAFKAARYDSVEKEFINYRTSREARISELEETLRKFEGSETGYRGGKKPTTQAPHEVPIEKAFMDALNQQAPI